MGIRTFTIISTFVAVSGSAYAEEDWAGYYGGISIDAARAKSDVGGNATHRHQDEAAGLGLYGGYNFVRSNGLVWGPELTLSGISTASTKTDTALGTSEFDGGFLLSPRVRVGYATGRTFVYGIAGLGITDVMARPSSTSGTDINITPSIGLGAEFAMGDGWRTKVEAVHHKFDTTEFDFNGTTTRPSTSITKITLGIGRKF